MWTLIFLFLKELLTGEVYRLWQAHKARERQQAVADTPESDKEWVDAASKGEL